MEGASITMEKRAHPSALPSRFQCTECLQTFGRVEHLTRHSRSHKKERFLKCPYCRKGFYRIDALRRHEQTHKEPKRSALGRGARACLFCAAARRKCSGETPCTGCHKRSLDCRYPDNYRPRISTRLSPVKAYLPSPREGKLTPLGVDHTNDNSQASPMSWSNASDSPAMEQGHEQLSSAATGNMTGSQNLPSSPGPEYIAVYSTQGLQMQTFITPGYLDLGMQNRRENPAMSVQQQQIDGPNQDEATSGTLPYSRIHLQSLDSHLATGTDNVQGSDLATEPWYQNNFSSINWLPDNWTPGFQVQEDNNFGSFEHEQPLLYGQETQNSPTNFPPASSNKGLQQILPHQLYRHRGMPRSPSQGPEGREMSSPGSQSTHSAGHYYVDGNGARLPRVLKAPYRHSDPRPSMHSIEKHGINPAFRFPVSGGWKEDAILTDFHIIPSTTYNDIVRIFNLTCFTSNIYTNFEGGMLPSSQTLSLFIYLYYRNFQAVMPFIHQSSFDICKTHWLLILALAAAGSHYIEGEESELLAVSMHEFLRRAIYIATENENLMPEPLLLIQAKILNCIGMMYCSDEWLKKSAKNYHNDLADFCTTECSKTTTENTHPTANDAEIIHHDWKIWCEAESYRRTWYCIWLLDCMWVFHFQSRPLLSLEDARHPLPCQEVLWEASSALDWQQLYHVSTPSPSLHSAIQLAYVEKKIQSSTGEFSRILCVHALFRRTWEVESYFKQPLAAWTPTAEEQSIDTISNSVSAWLPGIEIYSKWRNSACDCLDILHWHANSVIGAASGMEHPTVLHLHLARVILLTPFREIQRLVNVLIDSSHTPNNEGNFEIAKARKDIQRWVMEDQHKARLAMIHAGVLFWHVRRYSTDAFYEPSSVFLATLALWAYGTFATQASNISESPEGDDDVENFFPTSIQLDRPTDDELVQLYVRRGAGMRANITGVGNLCSEKGPFRVLVEGTGLINGLKRWGVSRTLGRRLSGLIEVVRLREEGNT